MIARVDAAHNTQTGVVMNRRTMNLMGLTYLVSCRTFRISGAEDSFGPAIKTYTTTPTPRYSTKTGLHGSQVAYQLISRNT